MILDITLICIFVPLYSGIVHYFYIFLHKYKLLLYQDFQFKDLPFFLLAYIEKVKVVQELLSDTFLISFCWFYDMVGQYIKSVCDFYNYIPIYNFGSNIQNSTKLYKNINIGLHTFHPIGQTKVGYIKMCYKTTFSNKLYFNLYLEELKQTLRVYTCTCTSTFCSKAIKAIMK